MLKTVGHYLRHKHATVWLAESSLLMLAEAQFLHYITTDVMLPFVVVYSASIIIPYKLVISRKWTAMQEWQ